MSENPTENVAGDQEAGTTARSPTRKGGPLSGTLGVFIFLVLFATAAYLTWRTLRTAPPPEVRTVEIVYVCAETNKTFRHTPVEGEQEPIVSPYSNRRTGYRPESCYWTKDGRQKTEPTYIILNERLGKKGPTVCPDCGRLVLPHNPLPPIDTPPAVVEDKPATTQPATAEPATAQPENP